MLDENFVESEEANQRTGSLKRKCDEMSTSSRDLSNDEDRTTPGDNEIDSDLPVKKLSKRQQRKLRKREAWLASKPEKRAKERKKIKAKRREARLSNIDLGPNRKTLKNKTMASSACKIHVAVDMSFDDYMTDRDLSKCLKQLLRCYSLNRRADNPMQLFFTSFSGKCKTHMEKNNGYKNWDINFKEEYITDVFSKEKLVYLSSDSPNTILTLEEDKIYVIGGLVDHNVHKGLCHKIAVEKGLSHAQLPIREFLKMSSRKVLTVDHVFEILLNVSTGLSWKEAFLKVIPKRKGALPKKDEDSTDEVSLEVEDAIGKDSGETDDSEPVQKDSGIAGESTEKVASETDDTVGKKDFSDSEEAKEKDCCDDSFPQTGNCEDVIPVPI